MRKEGVRPRCHKILTGNKARYRHHGCKEAADANEKGKELVSQDAEKDERYKKKGAYGRCDQQKSSESIGSLSQIVVASEADHLYGSGCQGRQIPRYTQGESGQHGKEREPKDKRGDDGPQAFSDEPRCACAASSHRIGRKTAPAGSSRVENGDGHGARKQQEPANREQCGGLIGCRRGQSAT